MTMAHIHFHCCKEGTLPTTLRIPVCWGRNRPFAERNLFCMFPLSVLHGNDFTTIGFLLLLLFKQMVPQANGRDMLTRAQGSCRAARAARSVRLREAPAHGLRALEGPAAEGCRGGVGFSFGWKVGRGGEGLGALKSIHFLAPRPRNLSSHFCFC